MFKIIKWILLILIGLQLINWYMLKNDTPISVVLTLEENGCSGINQMVWIFQLVILLILKL